MKWKSNYLLDQENGAGGGTQIEKEEIFLFTQKIQINQEITVSWSSESITAQDAIYNFNKKKSVNFYLSTMNK